MKRAGGWGLGLGVGLGLGLGLGLGRSDVVDWEHGISGAGPAV